MRKFLSLVVALAAMASPVAAQSQAELVTAFSGPRQVYDRQMASGSDYCKITLAGSAQGQRFKLATQGCEDPLGSVSTSSIESNQLVFYDTKDTPLTRLGGSQKRVTGMSAAGTPIILERPGGDGTAAALQGAVNASGCYFLGYTKTCATKTDVAAPKLPASGGTKIKMLVDLGVRAEPRIDADVVGAVKAEQCISVDTCTVASDGPWCKAAFGQTNAWIRKLTLRQNRWPVITFTNSCS